MFNWEDLPLIHNYTQVDNVHHYRKGYCKIDPTISPELGDLVANRATGGGSGHHNDGDVPDVAPVTT